MFNTVFCPALCTLGTALHLTPITTPMSFTVLGAAFCTLGTALHLTALAPAVALAVLGFALCTFFTTGRLTRVTVLITKTSTVHLIGTRVTIS